MKYSTTVNKISNLTYSVIVNQLFQITQKSNQNIPKILTYNANCRTFCNGPAVQPKPDPVGPPKRSLPPLMDFPELVWPSVFKSVRNWILSTLIIAPYFDREFSLYDFVVGSKRAVEVIITNSFK